MNHSVKYCEPVRVAFQRPTKYQKTSRLSPKIRRFVPEIPRDSRFRIWRVFEYGAACDKDLSAGAHDAGYRVVMYAAVYLNAKLQTARLADLREQFNSRFSTCNLRTIRLQQRHFLHHAFADPFSAQIAYGPKIVFAFDDGQPGDAAIEHGG